MHLDLCLKCIEWGIVPVSTPGIRGKRARMLEIGTIYTGTLAA
jgi:hypothetical protein